MTTDVHNEHADSDETSLGKQYYLIIADFLHQITLILIFHSYNNDIVAK